jgi:hypothetical protein
MDGFRFFGFFGTQLGFPEKFVNSKGWHISTNNFCQWCPDDGTSTCGMHHQSPIPLKRDVVIKSDPEAYMCLDDHLMEYRDSSCSFEELKQKNAFVIDRFALRIIQPVVTTSGDDLSYNIDCGDDTASWNDHRWGRIDFSNGFPDWWLLSHTDFHVPSEHTQNGKRYSGEIQMYHFYSVPPDEAGINNEVSRFPQSVFLFKPRMFYNTKV